MDLPCTAFGDFRLYVVPVYIDNLILQFYLGLTVKGLQAVIASSTCHFQGERLLRQSEVDYVLRSKT